MSEKEWLSAEYKYNNTNFDKKPDPKDKHLGKIKEEEEDDDDDFQNIPKRLRKSSEASPTSSLGNKNLSSNIS